VHAEQFTVMTEAPTSLPKNVRSLRTFFKVFFALVVLSDPENALFRIRIEKEKHVSLHHLCGRCYKPAPFSV